MMPSSLESSIGPPQKSILHAGGGQAHTPQAPTRRAQVATRDVISVQRGSYIGLVERLEPSGQILVNVLAASRELA